MSRLTQIAMGNASSKTNAVSLIYKKKKKIPTHFPQQVFSPTLLFSILESLSLSLLPPTHVSFTVVFRPLSCSELIRFPRQQISSTQEPCLLTRPARVLVMAYHTLHIQQLLRLEHVINPNTRRIHSVAYELSLPRCKRRTSFHMRLMNQLQEIKKECCI